jgi:hypothetical protein
MTLTTIERHLETETGILTGTFFRFWPDDNTLGIGKQNSDGEHWITLTGYEAIQLRRFLNDHLTQRRTKPDGQ